PRKTPKEIPFSGGLGRIVYKIEVHDVIDLGLAPFIQRTLKEAELKGAAAVILDMNTPGGRVDAAVQIKDALLSSKVKTITFVNKEAISAGALIAYATDFIIVSEGATMGAATPITLGAEGSAKPVEEKYVSYMRSMMRATAEAKGRDGDIAEAMVDADKEIPGISEKGKLLTATSKQALEWGIADFKAESFDEVLKTMKLEGALVEAPAVNWAENIARFLTHPIVSSIMMSLGFLGILIELYTPGFGLAGILGITCLLLFFLGHYVVNLAGLEEVLLFAAGIVSLFIELFVTPGFGLLGIAGIILIGASLLLALTSLPIEISFETGDFSSALFRVVISFIATIVCAVLFFRFFPRTKPGRRLVLEQGISVPVAYQGANAESAISVGDEGTAVTDLHPVGKGLFNGRKLEISTEGDYIPKGTAVKVVDASGGRIFVKKTVK
ncbi:MAG: nodulation protein NfeD, partial [Deltaproteobacteria bacterium]|nr:nodulation protein NfeD [Deltaproteobacteria bacterium]